MHPISNRIFTGGTFRPGGGALIHVLDPSTAEVLGAVPDATPAEVDVAVSAAADAFPSWARTPPRRRGQLLAGIAAGLRGHAKELAGLDARDSGRTLAETHAQVERSAQQLEYCAGYADKLEGRVVPLGGDTIAYTVLEPFGVVAALTPWNAPLLQIAQKASHALATGNTIVVKPSPLACFTALAFAEIASEAGLPPGVLNVLTGGAETGRALVRHPDVAKVTFTGSVGTGREIAGVCAQRGIPVTLELGGKCPLLVFGDADIPKAAAEAARAAFAGAGQSCVAAARILVEDRCFDDFSACFDEAITRYVGGDPLDGGTVMGPLISATSRERVAALVDDALAHGGRLAHRASGGAARGGGFFMDAVALADVPGIARIVVEEIFGPVTCIERFDGVENAVAAANRGPFGLAAAVYTGDFGRAERICASLSVGNVWVNCYKHLDPALPFGGKKESGIGRECGIDGLLEFAKPKSIVRAYEA